MKKILLGAIATVAISSTAFAADLPARTYTNAAPVVAPIAYSWSGCYVGGQAGGAWSRSHHTLDNGAGLVEAFGYNPSSFIGGGQVGCQYQFPGNFVLGAEGTWSWVDLKQTDVSVLAPPRTRFLGIDQIATATVKLGYAWDRWMVYGKGGFADARIDTFAINPVTTVSADVNRWQSGWTVGGGIEYMIVQNFILGAEFNYYNFKYDRAGVLATDGTIGSYFNTKAEVYSVMARASWLFNWGGPVVARY
jgi:outer membrane immunogenic protein